MEIQAPRIYAVRACVSIHIMAPTLVRANTSASTQASSQFTTVVRVGRAAYETAVRLYPRDTIQYRDGARIIARSEPGQ
jgi:hypothetical protein